MRITISGPPGSGKTTVCRILGEHLGLEIVSSGHIFRQMAEEREMSLAEFGHLCETDPEADLILDNRMVEIARNSDNICLEGRLSAHMLTRHSIEAFRVLMLADIDERSKRVVTREGGTWEQRKREIEDREASEAKRYKAYYNIDINDKDVYDLVIDTTNIPAEDVAGRIIREVRKHSRDACKG
ncbi:MAG: AAA family ATPase [Euryarchaeota archaeon]|nr:AAA family ATPase [Euryarchaeota archaeon]